jgi:hypothetical protein
LTSAATTAKPRPASPARAAFDGGVERENVGGLGDLVDVVRALLDLAHRRRKAGDVLGQRVDQLEQLADLGQRGADMIRALPSCSSERCDSSRDSSQACATWSWSSLSVATVPSSAVCSALSRSDEARTDWTSPDTSEQPSVTSAQLPKCRRRHPRRTLR